MAVLHRDACALNDVIGALTLALVAAADDSATAHRHALRWRAASRALVSLQCEWNVLLATRIAAAGGAGTASPPTTRLHALLRAALVRAAALL